MIQVRFIYVYIEGNRAIPRWSFLIIHGGIEKLIGTFISFFRSFTSFFRSFISPLGGKFSFSRELLGNFSGEISSSIAHSDYSC